MFEMTWNQAKAIQDRQMVYYRRLIGRKGVKAIKNATSCPDHINPDALLNIFTVNELVPRGGSFERHLNGNRVGEITDMSGYHMHNAMASGKIYH